MPGRPSHSLSTKPPQASPGGRCYLRCTDGEASCSEDAGPSTSTSPPTLGGHRAPHAWSRPSASKPEPYLTHRTASWSLQERIMLFKQAHVQTLEPGLRGPAAPPPGNLATTAPPLSPLGSPWQPREAGREFLASVHLGQPLPIPVQFFFSAQVIFCLGISKYNTQACNIRMG